jgi:tetratricopeptide (TPR) repeat protein
MKLLRQSTIREARHALAMGFFLIVAACSTFAGDESTAIPAISLKDLEPQVARQLESVQSLLLEVLARRQATAKERADAYGEFGRLLHAYGYGKEAAECYRHASVHQPEDARWLHLLGCACESTGSLAEAEAAFRKAAKRNETQATQIHLGNTLMQEARQDEAKKVFRKLLADDPRLAAAHAALGTLLLEEQNFQDSIKHLSEALELAPAATRLHYSLAMAYRGAGDLDRARHHLRLRGDVGLKPTDPLLDELPQLIRGAQVHLMRGKIAFAAGAIPDAIREYRLAIEAAPENVTAHVNLAAALVQARELDEAIQHLQAALKLEPHNATALFNLSSIEYSRGHFTQAADYLVKLVELEPRDLAARQLLARSLLGLKDHAKALEILRASLALAPDDESTALQLAELLVALEKHDEARTVLHEQFRAHPTRGLTAHALARFLASCPDSKLRDSDLALKLATAVQKANPTLEHTETLAMALAASNRFDEAVRLQKQLLEAAQRAADIRRIRENLKLYEQGQAVPHK